MRKIFLFGFIFPFILLYSSIFSQTVNFRFTIKGTLQPISPYIFGTNQILTGDENYTALRQGGNRLTGYNWENNASNAGSDYQQNSDNYLTSIAGIKNEDDPGIVTTTFHDNAQNLGIPYSLVTLQMAGFVAKDKNGPVTVNQTAPSSRWVRVSFTKNSPFSLTPDLTDTSVFMDEYVNFLVTKYGKANTSTGIRGYSLDNEPALWPSTHPRIHPLATTCQEISQKGIDLAKVVKSIDDKAEIFGPVLYGFGAYLNFQSAPDWTTVSKNKNYSWFIDYYLDRMKQAESDNGGKRLLDVLDLHWYPEAIGDNRITNSNATTAKDNAARIQAPRTLWDKKYVENSWIAQSFKSYLPLIPKILASINSFYPGTKLGFTEITYGGPDHISGAIAMADVLGIFAKYGVYCSNQWPLSNTSPYTAAAYRIYRNYDGSKSTFGDYYISSITSDSVNTSVYGSIKNGSNEIHVIAINKSLTKSIAANFSFTTDRTIQSGRVWAVDSSSSLPREITPVGMIGGNSFGYTLPAGSVCHLVLKTGNVLSGTENQQNQLSKGFSLGIYPNPFNPECQIEYSMPQNSRAILEIVSITGSIVKTFNNLSNNGRLVWNGTNNNNQKVASGVYCAVLRDASSIYQAKKLMLLK